MTNRYACHWRRMNVFFLRVLFRRDRNSPNAGNYIITMYASKEQRLLLAPVLFGSRKVQYPSGKG